MTERFEEPLHVGRPNMGNRAAFDERVRNILNNLWLTNGGPYSIEFEFRLSRLLQVRNCVAICNATVALEIAIRALELHGEVIVPSFTFIATAHALQWQQVTPVFCDIDPSTHNIDPACIEALITPRTTGIIGVHLWGRPCAIDLLQKIAERNDLKLLFDASHALGCSYKQQPIGGFGSAEVFSFHATKFINSLEGGVIATNDDNLATKLRSMRNFGFVGYDRTEHVGTNGKMNEVCAAMGVTNLESLDQFVSVNRRNYEAYRTGLDDIPGLSLIAYEEGVKSNYQYIVTAIDPELSNVSRDHLLELLHKQNVIARRYFYPGCHRMEPYRRYFPNAGLLLPETEKLAERVLCLPTGSAVSSSDVSRVCKFIRDVMAPT